MTGFEEAFEGHADLLIKPPSEAECVSTFPELVGDDEVLPFAERRCLYFLSRRKGNDHTWAMISATQTAPRGMTDDVALGGMQTISDMYEHDPKATDRLCRIMERRGYRPKPTDVYLTSVANSEGDPLAIINHGQGRGHIRRVLEARGQAGNGLVDIEGRQPEQDPYENPHHKLNPKIVERIRKRKLKANPDLAHKDQSEIRSEIIEQHATQPC